MTVTPVPGEFTLKQKDNSLTRTRMVVPFRCPASSIAIRIKRAGG